MKKLIIMFFALCFVFGGCGNSTVSKEEYDKVVAERDELKNKIESSESDALKKTKDSLTSIDGLSFSEQKYGKYNVLIIGTYSDLNMIEETKANIQKFSEILLPMMKEEWFEYNYVFLVAWDGTIGAYNVLSINAIDYSTKTLVEEK